MDPLRLQELAGSASSSTSLSHQSPSLANGAVVQNSNISGSVLNSAGRDLNVYNHYHSSMYKFGVVHNGLTELSAVQDTGKNDSFHEYC